MKLRFRGNSLRLRMNQKEVQTLASGMALQEQIVFPGDATFAYMVEPIAGLSPAATFANGAICIQAPRSLLTGWAEGEEIGVYFELPVKGDALKIAIEKDLECLDGPPGELDSDAFPRLSKVC